MENQNQIFGIRAIIEAITAGKSVDKVFIQKGLKGALFNELEPLLKQHNINTAYVPVEKLNKLAKKGQNHQGVVATISPIAFEDLETLITKVQEKEQTPLFLLLDQLSDVRNFGAIIRTAECTGVHGIIIQKKGAAPVTADTVKTSAGAAFRVPICKVDHIKDAVFLLQAYDIQVVAATEKAEKSIHQVGFTTPTAIIMGSEDVGIAPSVLKAANEKAKLPMLGEIGSLNVSVACGVFLYEVVRQRMASL